MIKRRKTRTVTVGNVKIGSGHPVSIQSMAKTDTSDIAATAAQIRELEDAGCEIIRVAVKDAEDAKAIAQIKQEITIPVVADIHFDHRLALESIESGADKIRINPGNITNKAYLDAVIEKAKERKVPIRVGVNSGSLMDVATGRAVTPAGMKAAVLKYLEAFDKKGFRDIVLSLKSSSVPSTVEAYRLIASECDYPLHVGVTAAGLPADGIIKSSMGIGTLLMEGIGDTIRVSLTGDPVDEVDVAKRILSASGSRHFGCEIIACPTCGRCQVDLVSIVKELDKELKRDTRYEIQDTDKQLVIAIMGCEVNGPGEAKEADIGIAFGKGSGAIFAHGKIIKTVAADSAIRELLEMIKKEI